ncbi:MAG: Fe-S cluster assembly ATPase SufC [Candidatus Nanohaloarchaea archaeon]|nr:Fe-S cluster assembly ATPase SufC [Candidatus Nanohaloarchaea archaeon]
MTTLDLRDLEVDIDGDRIVDGVSLTVEEGEVHALMGPNGSGKSTLAHALMGHPDYDIVGGEALLDGEDILQMEPDERSRAGLFLAFQYPSEIPGVTVSNFLRTALNARLPEDQEVAIDEFQDRLARAMDLLDIDEAFAERYLNDGFSGGEKKRTEILQMAVLEPSIAVLDEVDSGLDIDALKTVADGINTLRGEDIGFLMITHYQRILDYVEPDYVHVMIDGEIVEEGGKELAHELEDRGYEWLEDGGS